MVEIENVRKAELIVDFVSTLCEIVKVKSLNHNIEQFRKFNKPNSPFSSDLFVAYLARIQVVFIKHFRFYVSLNTQFDATAVYLLVYVLNH